MANMTIFNTVDAYKDRSESTSDIKMTTLSLKSRYVSP